MSENEQENPREEILRATLEVIAEHSINDTRMRHIASRADMSQGNLHHHFKTKGNLFIALVDEIINRFTTERSNVIYDNDIPLETKIRFILEQKKHFLRDEVKVLRVFYDFLVQAMAHPEIREKMKEPYENWRRDIKEVVNQYNNNEAIDPRRNSLIPKIMVALMEGAALQVMIDPKAIDLDAYFDVVLDIILALIHGLDPIEELTTPEN